VAKLSPFLKKTQKSRQLHRATEQGVMKTWKSIGQKISDAEHKNRTNSFYRTQQGEIVQFSFEFLSGTVRHSVATQRTR